MTRVHAEVQVGEATWEEVAAVLEAAGYQHAFIAPNTIDMHGLALVKPVREAPAMTVFKGAFNDVQKSVHLNAVQHGFWEDYPEDLSEDQVASKLALIHSEISEALEAVRDNYPESRKIAMMGQFEEELADAIIRIMDLAEYTGVDVARALIEKAAYNRGRPYKHGKTI